MPASVLIVAEDGVVADVPVLVRDGAVAGLEDEVELLPVAGRLPLRLWLWVSLVSFRYFWTLWFVSRPEDCQGFTSVDGPVSMKHTPGVCFGVASMVRGSPRIALFALLCLGLGAGAVLPSRAGVLPHPSFGMDRLGLYRTVCLLFEGEFPLRVGSDAPDLVNT